MNVVYLSLTNLRAQHRLGQAPPETMTQLYTEVEDFLEEAATRDLAVQQLHEESSLLKDRLIDLVDSLASPSGSPSDRAATLAALTAGMFAGALDGMLLFVHNQRVKQPIKQSCHPALQDSSRLLWENLERVLEVGQANWAEAHVDDLQLLSGYGKHENRRSLEEGQESGARSGEDRLPFQSFILASFKGGYAMGVVDAAVMFVGKERPGAPPQPS